MKPMTLIHRYRVGIPPHSRDKQTEFFFDDLISAKAFAIKSWSEKDVETTFIVVTYLTNNILRIEKSYV